MVVLLGTTIGAAANGQNVERFLRAEALGVPPSAAIDALPNADCTQILKGLGLETVPIYTVAASCASGLSVLDLAAGFVSADLYDSCLAICIDMPQRDGALERAFRRLGVYCSEQEYRNADLRVDTPGVWLAPGCSAALLTRPTNLGAAWHLESVASVGGIRSRVTPDSTELSGVVGAVGAVDLDGVIIHGSGTVANLEAESGYLDHLDPPEVLALKSKTGHTLGASGLLEIDLAVRSGCSGRWLKVASGFGGTLGAAVVRI